MQRISLGMVCALLGALCVSFLHAEDKPGDRGAEIRKDPTLAKLGTLAGGTWSGYLNPEKKLGLVEFRYEWDFHGTVIHGKGAIMKGTPNEMQAEAFLGWDPAKKSVYYLDVHDGQLAFLGTVKLDSDKLQYDFQSIVGPAGTHRSVAEFPDGDTYKFTIYSNDNGQWKPGPSATLKRQK